MDQGLAGQLELQQERLPSPLPAQGLDGHVMGIVRHLTIPSPTSKALSLVPVPAPDLTKVPSRI